MNDLTWRQVRDAAEVYWPGIGGAAVDQMIEWNETLFDGKLAPAPVVLSRMSSVNDHWFPLIDYGSSHRLGYEMSVGSDTRSEPPRRLMSIRKGSLLRGMMLRYLEDQKLSHAPGGADWCALVVDIHKKLTGKRIWAAPKIERYETPQFGPRRIVHEQAPDPLTGRPSISPSAVRNWPTESIDLGDIVRLERSEAA
ncbi:MAG: hypothetical protein AB7S74_01895 [Hyphomicrobium sp.]